MHEFDAEALIEFGEAWHQLGFSIQEQVTHVCRGTANSENVGATALRYARNHLEGYDGKVLIDQIDAWLEENPEEED